MENFAERLQAIKKRFSLNNNQLAKLAGVTRTAIDHMENKTSSDPKSSTVLNIAKNLNLSIEWLMTGEGEMEREISTSDELLAENQVLKKKVDYLESKIELIEKKHNNLVGTAKKPKPTRISQSSDEPRQNQTALQLGSVRRGE